MSESHGESEASQQEDAPPTTEFLLLVGGGRHGEEVEVPLWASSWVNLLSADTYYRSSFTFVAQSPTNPQNASLRRGFRLEALVHESIHADRSLANAWLNALALSRVFGEFGREVPMAEIESKFRAPGAPSGDASMN